MRVEVELGKLKLKAGNKRVKPEIGSTGTPIWSGQIQEEYNADLRGQKAITKYDKMRRSDGMVKAMLLALSLPIRSAEWYIESSDDVDDAHTELVNEALFNKMSISFDEWLQHVLLMLPFGFSLLEKVFKIEDNKVWWKKLAPRLPKTLYKWKFDEAGGLNGITQYVQKAGGYTYIDIPIESLLVFTNDREGSNYEGCSVLRAAYKHWFIKDLLYRISGIGLERQAVGLPTITLPEGFSKKDRKKAKEIIEAIRTNEETGLVLPPGWDFENKEGKLKSKAILDHINHHDGLMAKSVLAQFLQLGQEGKGGAYALSKDQSDFFMMSLVSYCKIITNIMNRHAIPQLIDMNFGNVKKYPKLAFSLGGIDKIQLVEGITKLADKQVIVPQEEDEKYIRNLLGLPEIEKREELEAHEDRRNRKIRNRVKLAEGKYWRDLTKWEKGVKFKQIDDRFDKAEKAFIAELTGVTDKQIDGMLSQLEKAIESGKLNELYKVTVRNRGVYAETLRKYMKDLANFGKDMAAAETGVKIDKLSTNLKRWLNIKADSLVELHSAGLKSNAMIATLNAVNAGKATKGVLFDAKNAMGGYIKKNLTGTANVTVAESINQGRNEIVKSGEMQAAQYSAILDSRTCPICKDLDGKIVEVDNPDFDRFSPPAHSNCRCVWVYIKKEEKDVDINWSPPSQDLIEKHGSLIAKEAKSEKRIYIKNS